MQSLSYAAVLHNRKFRSLWLNQLALQFSYNMTNFALLLSIWHLTGSNTSTALLILAFTLPAILFGALAGIVADNLDRRTIILITDSLLAVMFLLYTIIPDNVAILLLLTFLTSTVAQFFMPAEAAAIPMLVSNKDLLVAQSLFSLTLNVSFIIGYTFAGPVILLFGPRAPFYMAALATALGFLSMRDLPHLIPARATSSAAHWLSHAIHEIKIGFRFVATHRFVSIPIVTLALLQSIIGIIATLIPGFMERIVGVHGSTASYVVMLPTGLGMMVGSLIIGRLCSLWARRVVVSRAIFGAGVLLCIMALLPLAFAHPRSQLITMGAGLFFFSILLGLCAVMIQVISTTVLQEHTPEIIKGRVFASLGMAVSGLAVIPTVIAGRLADLLGILVVLGGLGIAIVSIGFFASQHEFLRRILKP